jgi:hypothetical protein
LNYLEKQLGVNLERLNHILTPYIEDIADAEKHLSLDNKTLIEANKEQPGWMSYYDQRKIELNTYAQYIKLQIGSVEAQLFHAMRNYPQELTDTNKKLYIKKEPKYLEISMQYHTVMELFKKYESIVEAFRQRGFTLRNITNLRCASLEDSTF